MWTLSPARVALRGFGFPAFRKGETMAFGLRLPSTRGPLKAAASQELVPGAIAASGGKRNVAAGAGASYAVGGSRGDSCAIR